MDTGYLDYANDVISGKIIANKYIRLSCQRFLDDISSGKYYFNDKKYITIMAFTGILKHYSSGAAGKPFILENWQKFIVANLFCLYSVQTGKRKYKTGYVSVARKNGKTTLAAAMGLFALIADQEPAPSVCFAANSVSQAHIDFDCASVFAKQLDPKGKVLKILRNEITYPKINGNLKVIAADSTKQDGRGDSMVICDETHEFPNSKLFDVLRSGQGFRQQPLMLCITTAGFRIGGFCHQYENYCKSILSGDKQDDTVFAMIYSPDEGDNWTDRNTYIKSNPNLGVTVNEEWLDEQINQAKQSPSLEVGVRTKNLNQWVSSSTVWIPENIVRSSVRKLSISDFMGNKDYLCYLGFDLASVSDLTGLSVMFVNPSTGEYYFINKYYLPRKALDGKYNSELYRYWATKGYLTLTDSPTTDYNHIKGEIMYLYDNFDVQGIFYDSWNAQQLVNDLTSEGLPMYPYSQSIGNFNKPTREFERLILSGCIVMDDNPINRFCMDNVELKMDINGNAKPVGDHKSRKIDGVISMLNALGGYLSSTYSMGSAFVLPLNG